MSSWSDLLDELQKVDVNDRGTWITEESSKQIDLIRKHYGCNVLFYASSFLQKPYFPSHLMMLDQEDINGFMAGLHGLDFEKDLLFILHTPGGLAEAVQTIIDYLRSKFTSIDVLIPTYAMSAGTMLALGCDKIIMGRQSQLGPTDPQLVSNGSSFSAHSIVEQFEEAKSDISNTVELAHAWAPVLSAFGPALLQEARKSISYGESIVQDLLEKYAFSDHEDPKQQSEYVASFFAGNEHGSHGRRINREAARQQGLNVIDLEDDQVLQDSVLTLYHLTTIAFERTPACKTVISSNGNRWIKNFSQAVVESSPKTDESSDRPLEEPRVSTTLVRVASIIAICFACSVIGGLVVAILN